MEITVWGLLSLLAPILAPILAAVTVAIGRFVWTHEKRIRTLERGQIRHGRSIYGDDDDVQQTGISETLRDVIARLDRIESKVDDLESEVDK